MTILDRIVKTKRTEVAAAKARRPLPEVQAAAERADPPRDFHLAVMGAADDEVRLIAEIKKSSPSAGLIAADFDPVRIAQTYADHGAAAISVLTDETYFDGRLEFIDRVKRAVALPVLRKDFMIDEYQIYESRAAGADAVLLIAEILDAKRLAGFAATARQLGMAVLVESHNEENLTIVLDALGTPATGGYLLGINNRDLTLQRTDLSTMSALAKHLPGATRFVAESGIATREDVLTAARAGAGAVLVGESLLRAPDIGAKVDELLGK